ncbi:peroxidase TAP [Infundibulicybe gibba]|nr:peroxidase TAP [Infundibulicybe gibba]
MGDPPLDLNNIQGDSLVGLLKKTETFTFFQIGDVKAFKLLLTLLLPFVTTAEQALANRHQVEHHKKGGGTGLIKLPSLNIAFSHFGFQKLGIDDKSLTVDTAFKSGQLADAFNLGDDGKGDPAHFDPEWDPAFKEQIHGVIISAGDSDETLKDTISKIEHHQSSLSGLAMTVVKSINGTVRPGKEKGHEHFGFLDGISNPLIIGFTKNPPPPGPKPVPAGILLTGRDGDEFKAKRELWSTDGSYLVFRYLFQKVPEFHNFLDENPVKLPGLTKEDGSKLFGARLVGRWPSGVPVGLAPWRDDPHVIENDPDKTNLNDFLYVAEQGFPKICPFTAHNRKTNPRNDLPEDIDAKCRIMRRGVQFGPEVQPDEKKEKKTLHGRGLLFACYQSNIVNGFQFVQTQWANDPDFITEGAGIDFIIGQGRGENFASGFNPRDPQEQIQRPGKFVVPDGGEYFFTPSLSGLKHIAES